MGAWPPEGRSPPTREVSAVRQARGGRPLEASSRVTTSSATARAVVYFTASTVSRLAGPRPSGEPILGRSARVAERPRSRPALSGRRPHCRATTSRSVSPIPGQRRLNSARRVVAPRSRAAAGSAFGSATAYQVPRSVVRSCGARKRNRPPDPAGSGSLRAGRPKSHGDLGHPAADHQIERQRVARRTVRRRASAGSGGQRLGPRTGGDHDLAGGDPVNLAREPVAHGDGLHRAVSDLELDSLGVVRHLGPDGGGRCHERQREALGPGHARVVPEGPTGDAGSGESGDQAGALRR